jgi:hypothetical protein
LQLRYEKYKIINNLQFIEELLTINIRVADPQEFFAIFLSRR